MGIGRTVQDTAELPNTHHRVLTVDLKKDTKYARAVQLIFLVVTVVAVVPALLLPGLSLDSGWSPYVTIPVTVAGCLVYMAVHETSHGVSLRMLTGVKPTYAVRFPFLTTGNHAYLTRRSAVTVALAPGILWGIVLLGAVVIVPDDVRLTAYVLLALNFAGSAGDVVEAYLALRQPPDALMQDDGDKVHVFVPRN